jgi:antitoxin HigA-1
MKPMRLVTHPGDILSKYVIEGRGIDISTAAERSGLSEVYLQGLVDGRESIDQKAADALSKWIGTSAQFWINLQTNYDESK